MEEIETPIDSTIWQNRILYDEDRTPPENVDTTVEKYEYRDFIFLIKRRDEDSDKQMLTEIVVVDEELWGDDTGERPLVKYTKRFDDAEVKQVCQSYWLGRMHQKHEAE